MGLLSRYISERAKATFMLRSFGLTSIPLLYFVRPVVMLIDADKIVVKIPLRRRNRNHLNSMYFGALCIGADCSGGLLAMKCIKERSEKIALVFKDFTADFLKRAEGDTFFICEQGREISALVARVAHSSERREMTVRVIATVPSKCGDEPVATFAMTLSLKKK